MLRTPPAPTPLRWPAPPGTDDPAQRDIPLGVPGDGLRQPDLPLPGPEIIFVDANGREKAGTRLVGDVTKTTLNASAGRMESVQ